MLWSFLPGLQLPLYRSVVSYSSLAIAVSPIQMFQMLQDVSDVSGKLSLGNAVSIAVPEDTRL